PRRRIPCRCRPSRPAPRYSVWPCSSRRRSDDGERASLPPDRLSSVEDRPLDDLELTRRAKEGDMDAYAQLVRAYQPLAVRLAHLLCGGAADAEDAAQEGFIKAYRALDRHRDGAPLRPWLLTIVANEARNRRRAAGRCAHYELTMVEDRASGEAVPSPEAAVLT